MLPLRYAPLALLVLTVLSPSAIAATSTLSPTENKLDPFSLIRVGQQINFMTSVKFNDGRTAQKWRAVDCQQRKAEELYWDLLDEKGVTQMRYYGKSYQRYAPPQPVEKAPEAELNSICNLPVPTAVWEKVADTDQYGMTALIDLATLSKVNDKFLSVRVGYDNAAINWEPPYDAPVSLKVEHYMFNCSTQTGLAIAAMNVDQAGRVTDSLMTANIMRRQDSFSLDEKVKKSLLQVCAQPADKPFKALGTFTPAQNKPASTIMGPSMPELSGNPAQWLAQYPLPAEVERQMQALIKPWALPRFKQISYREVRNKTAIDVQLDAQADGYIRKLEDYGIWKVQRIMLGNELQLKFAMSISSQAGISKDLRTDLRFPLVSGQRFQASYTNNLADEADGSAITLRCEVTGEGDAKTINPAFSGQYLLLDCTNTATGKKMTRYKSAWLKDFNVSVPLSSKLGDEPEETVKLENVRVIR